MNTLTFFHDSNENLLDRFVETYQKLTDYFYSGMFDVPNFEQETSEMRKLVEEYYKLKKK
jgi:hypothetical protein